LDAGDVPRASAACRGSEGTVIVLPGLFFHGFRVAGERATHLPSAAASATSVGTGAAS
jgi:hypothetical protein